MRLGSGPRHALGVAAGGPVPGLDLSVYADLNLQVRLGGRGKRLRLAVREGRVELSIPTGFDAETVHRFVARHRDWIGHHRQAQDQQIELARGALSLDPAQPRAPLWGRQRAIILHRGAPAVSITDDAIAVGLDPQRPRAQRALGRLLRAAFAQQLRERAMRQLPSLQERLGLRCSTIRIRAMRSLWGSLSPAGAVSLNLGLVFLPVEYADYVLAHELAHLRQRNHSPAFWRVVANLYPDWRAARSGLRAQHGYVQALLERLDGGG